MMQLVVGYGAQTHTHSLTHSLIHSLTHSLTHTRLPRDEWAGDTNDAQHCSLNESRQGGGSCQRSTCLCPHLEVSTVTHVPGKNDSFIGITAKTLLPGGYTHSLPPGSTAPSSVLSLLVLVPRSITYTQCRVTAWLPRRACIPSPVCSFLQPPLHAAHHHTLSFW